MASDHGRQPARRPCILVARRHGISPRESRRDRHNGIPRRPCRPKNSRVAYASSKAAVISMTRALGAGSGVASVGSASMPSRPDRSTLPYNKGSLPPTMQSNARKGAVAAARHRGRNSQSSALSAVRHGELRHRRNHCHGWWPVGQICTRPDPACPGRPQDVSKAVDK